jgi:hypothetical protein
VRILPARRPRVKLSRCARAEETPDALSLRVWGGLRGRVKARGRNDYGSHMGAQGCAGEEESTRENVVRGMAYWFPLLPPEEKHDGI